MWVETTAAAVPSHHCSWSWLYEVLLAAPEVQDVTDESVTRTILVTIRAKMVQIAPMLMLSCSNSKLLLWPSTHPVQNICSLWSFFHLTPRL